MGVPNKINRLIGVVVVVVVVALFLHDYFIDEMRNEMVGALLFIGILFFFSHSPNILKSLQIKRANARLICTYI